jgi:hypothetical protein
MEAIMIPDYIKQFKPPHSEIRHKNGHYYVYAVKGVYDKVAGKSKSISQGCIGQIYKDVGFVPNKKTAPPIEMITCEYGATRIVMATSADLMERLRDCFPSEFLRIYTLAVLKVLSNVSMRDLNIAYGKSAISKMLPEVHLSKNTLTTFLEQLSLNRAGMVKYMTGFHHFNGDSILFDGTSFISQFTHNPFVEKGYCPGNKGKVQLRLLYAFNKTTRLPIYFYVAPGNIPDVTLFEVAAGEMGIANCVVIFDNGFYRRKNIDFILESDIEFIVPLKRNTKEVPDDAKPFSAHDKVKLQHFFYNKRIVYYAEYPSKTYNGCRTLVYYDSERHQYLQDNYFDRIDHISNDGAPKQESGQIIKDIERLGVSMLLSNLGSTPEEIYRDYKSRWEIEEMFDTHKNTLGFKMNYEASLAAQEAWAFIEFIALQMFYKIDGILINNKMIKSMNVEALLFTASRITQAKIGDKWNICNVTEKDKALFSKLGVELLPIA